MAESGIVPQAPVPVQSVPAPLQVHSWTVEPQAFQAAYNTFTPLSTAITYAGNTGAGVQGIPEWQPGGAGGGGGGGGQIPPLDPGWPRPQYPGTNNYIPPGEYIPPDFNIPNDQGTPGAYGPPAPNSQGPWQSGGDATNTTWGQLGNPAGDGATTSVSGTILPIVPMSADAGVYTGGDGGGGE